MVLYDKEVLQNAEEVADDKAAGLALLRQMSLDAWGQLLLHIPHPDYPKLSAILPHRTDDQVQQSYTGGSGETLLRASLVFVNSVVSQYSAITGRSISDATILDFGCGWGRLLRLMYYFVESNQLFGCDAWQASVDYTMASKIPATIAKSEVAPECLPFDEKFDIAYAFSIFTHLSEPVTKSALNAIYHSLKPGGLAVITIRPRDIWQFAGERRGADYAELERLHDQKGFAFLPANPNAEYDAQSYGDTSMTLAYLRANFPYWEIVKSGRTFVDPMQTVVYLRPR